MNYISETIILIVLIIISVLYGLVMMLICMKREMLLHKRCAINYNNYNEMKVFFNVSLSKKIVISCICSILSNVIVGCLIMYNDLLNIYLILIAMTLILNFLGLYSYISSKKYNRNLKEFDEYYNQLESSYANKEKIVNNLKYIDSKYQFVNGEIQKVYKKISELVTNASSSFNVKECFEPLDKIKKEQEDILMSFDDKMPQIFTESLIMYLKNGGQINAQTYIFNPKIDLNLDPIVSVISDNLKNKYKTVIHEAFLNRKYKGADALVEMVNILVSFNLFEDKYINIIVDEINSNPAKNKPLVKFLFDKKYVNFSLISKCLAANKDWVLEYPIARLISKNELTTLTAEIIKNNNANITNKLLMLADKNYIESIKNGINVAAINNDSSIIMLRYVELLELDGGFNSLSNRYENIALSLNNYFISINSLNLDVDAIINNSSFYENRKFLDDTYSLVLSKLEPVIMKTFKSMLHFSLYCAKDFKYFAEEKINTIYVQYKQQLNVLGLLCLSSLLDAIILTYAKEDAAAKVVKESIDNLSGDVIYEKFYPVTGNKVNNLKLYGKDIIQNLFKNNKQELSTLVNHIENERLVLDKIRYM